MLAEKTPCRNDEHIWKPVSVLADLEPHITSRPCALTLKQLNLTCLDKLNLLLKNGAG